MFNIMIADKSLQSARLIADCLSTGGYGVMTSDSGANLLNKTKFFVPDLLICSTALADMSGFDLCKKFKNGSRTKDCLVLLLYSTDAKEIGIRSLESGVDDFMEISFDSLALKAKVKSLLRIKSLSNQLKDKYCELEEKNNILDMQLEMSRQVQSSLIQKPDISLGGAVISNLYLPATAVGGDFYDIIPIDETKAAIIIGDVSGHGISSALITTMALVMIRNLSEYFQEPSELLRRLNNQFCDVFANSKNDVYLCALVAFLDTEKQVIEYSNAGLVPPVYANHAIGSAMELNISGVPIGMFKNISYESKVLNYNKNDLLMFFTDGLMDALYKDSPQEFITNLSDILLHTEGGSLEAIKNMVLDGFYKKNPSGIEKLTLDDVCFILCRL